MLMLVGCPVLVIGRLERFRFRGRTRYRCTAYSVFRRYLTPVVRSSHEREEDKQELDRPHPKARVSMSLVPVTARSASPVTKARASRQHPRHHTLILPPIFQATMSERERRGRSHLTPVPHRRLETQWTVR